MKGRVIAKNIGSLEPNKLNIVIWTKNFQTLVQKSVTLIANIADDFIKNGIERDEKAISNKI